MCSISNKIQREYYTFETITLLTSGSNPSRSFESLPHNSFLSLTYFNLFLTPFGHWLGRPRPYDRPTLPRSYGFHVLSCFLCRYPVLHFSHSIGCDFTHQHNKNIFPGSITNMDFKTLQLSETHRESANTTPKSSNKHNICKQNWSSKVGFSILVRVCICVYISYTHMIKVVL